MERPKKERRWCKEKKRDGTPCPNNVWKDDLCFSHHPKSIEKREATKREKELRKKIIPLRSKEETPHILETIDEKGDLNFAVEGMEYESWKAFLKVKFGGKKLDEQERKVAEECTSRIQFPEKGFTETYAIVGRQGGKSSTAALIACYLALFCGHLRENVRARRGQILWIFVIATTKDQAGNIMNYIKGILGSFPKMIEGQIAKEEVQLINKMGIKVMPANQASVRGPSTAAIILDELAFFPTEEFANPAEQILTALKPGLIEGGLLIGISTGYSTFGLLFDKYEEHFGRDDSDVLIWQAPTRMMNPTFPEHKINKMMEEDPLGAASEYFGKFRERDSFIPEETYDSLVAKGVYRRAREPGIFYRGFVDPGGGGPDSMTLAIAHVEENKIILDLVEERVARYKPKEVTKEFCRILKDWGIHKVEGDRYAAVWTSGAFQKHGVQYNLTELDKSGLYSEARSIMMSGAVELLDWRRMKTQFMFLERRPLASGKIKIDHPRHSQDDVANAVAGVLVLAAKDIQMQVDDREVLTRLVRFSSTRGPYGVSREEPSPWRKEEAMKRVVEQIRKDGHDKNVDPSDLRVVEKYCTDEEIERMDREIER